MKNPPSLFFLTGKAPRGPRQRIDDREEDPPRPRRRARHRGRDDRLGRGQAVGQPQRRAAKGPDEQRRDALAEAGLLEARREEERDDDEPDDVVAEGRERLREAQRPAAHGGRRGDGGPGAGRERLEHEPRDRRDEDGQEGPRLGLEARRHRHEEAEGEADADGGREREEPGALLLLRWRGRRGSGAVGGGGGGGGGGRRGQQLLLIVSLLLLLLLLMLSERGPGAPGEGQLAAESRGSRGEAAVCWRKEKKRF